MAARSSRRAARVAPVRERGLKSGRGRDGADAHAVAPVRERGLKFEWRVCRLSRQSRSRKGAWIEILPVPNIYCGTRRRSRKGAWIEIKICL